MNSDEPDVAEDLDPEAAEFEEEDADPVDVVELAITRLRAILDAPAEQRGAALDALLEDSDALYGIRKAGLRSGEIQALMRKIHPKNQADIRRVAKDIARAADAGHVRLAEPGEVTDLRATIRAPEDWSAYPVPDGWQATPTGVLRLVKGADGVLRVLVADEPILVTGSRVDVGTSHESLILGFRRHGRWTQIPIPREHARDSRQLVGYSRVGLPVSSGTSRDLVAWLVACEGAGRKTIPRSEVTTRLGWHGDRYVAGPDGPIELEDPRGTRAGWMAVGTWDGWCETMAIGRDEPMLYCVVFAACVGPILRFLDIKHNPIVDVAGPSGRGKTTCLRAAGSAYGRPDELPGGTLRTWEATPTAIERTAADTCDCALLLDDSTRAHRPQAVGGVLYSLAQGQGRGRGTPGGMQVTATWRLVVISTGESPVIVATEAGGARRRVLSFTQTPQILGGRVIADALTAGFSAHYGHLATRIAAKALELGRDHLRARYNHFVERWAGFAAGADGRLVSTAALIDVAAEVAIECGIPTPSCRWRDTLADAVLSSIEMADQSGRALDVVRDELAQHRGQYHGKESQTKDGAAMTPSQGYRGIWRLGDDYIGIFPEVLRTLLEEAGHDFEPVTQRWADEGILQLHKGQRGRRYRVKIAGTPTWVYAFKLDKLDIEDPGAESEAPF